ncbi:MAG: M50 family metallopeptidase [Planctomycetota bacterium]|jgi:Zn-dependent protease
MPYEDRDYFRGSDRDGAAGFGGGSVLRRLLEILNLTFPIGTYLGIRVRVHITFILVVLIYMWSPPFDPLWTLRWTSLLFLSVLLHEFGHALACRSVGGEATDILMWPLGGLAYCAPPRRPWPEFVTVACGPLVNVVIAGAMFLTLLVWLGAASPVSLNPFSPWAGGHPGSGLAGLLADLYVVNYALLLFNLLLVFYPFDGGRLVQIALWTKLGYVRSLLIACTVGMVGAVLVALVGLAAPGVNLLLVAIAAFGFITCYQQKKHLQALGPDAAMLEDEQESWLQPQRRPDPITRWREARAERREQRENESRQRREQDIDRILDKVHTQGLASLSSREKRVLRQATDRQRQE